MIVLSATLDLEVEDDPPDTPWIGWRTIITTSSLSSDTEDDENPVTNLANPATHLFWRGGINTALDEHVEIITGTEDPINYLGIAKHNFGSEVFTVSVEAKIIGNSPDVWTTIIDEFVPDDDSALIFRFEAMSASHVRVRLQGGGDMPQASVFYLGELLVMERGILLDTDHTPLPLGRRDFVVSGMSESGNFLGRIKLREWRESVASFAHITAAWYRENFDPFVEQVGENPFFYAWQPVTYPEDTGFAWTTAEPIPEFNQETGRVAVELNMRGIA